MESILEGLTLGQYFGGGLVEFYELLQILGFLLRNRINIEDSVLHQPQLEEELCVLN